VWSLTTVPVAALINHAWLATSTCSCYSCPASVFKRLLIAVLRVTAAFPAPAPLQGRPLQSVPVMSARAAAAAADAEKKAAALAAAAKQAAIAAAAEEQARELKAKIDAAAGVIAPPRSIFEQLPMFCFCLHALLCLFRLSVITGMQLKRSARKRRRKMNSMAVGLCAR